MPNVFIFHGAYGGPNENWFPWLREELESIGCKVFTPTFPTPKEQTLDNWFKVFKKFEQYLDQDTVLIGHSLGATFILNLLEKTDKKVKAAFLVAGFVTKVVDPKDEVNTINTTFCKKKFDWKKIRASCNEFFVIGSDNDPYVTPEIAEKVSKPLGVRLVIIEGAGHFNKRAGYTKFPQLLDMVGDVLASSGG